MIGKSADDRNLYEVILGNAQAKKASGRDCKSSWTGIYDNTALHEPDRVLFEKI